MRSNTKLMQVLKKKKACSDAMKWLGGVSSMQEAYDNCERGEWLLWLAAKLDIDRKLIVLVACECAERALKHIPKGEDRPRKAIETARAWSRGEATLDEVRDAAYAAAEAAYAASDAAAAYAACYAACYAANAADLAAEAAADAAAEAAYADLAAEAAADAADAARAASLKESANIARKHIPFKLFKEAL